MCTLKQVVVATLGLAGLTMTASALGGERYGFGETPSKEMLSFSGWNIVVTPDGENLPPGSGTVSEGKRVYERSCRTCHGEQGLGGIGGQLVGGHGTLDSGSPVKTVESYWPYATTLFDYIHRAMPFDNPQSLTNDEVYAVIAYILYLADIVPEDTEMNARALRQVNMPNRDGFIADPRPDVFNTPCRKDC
ncbi:MAG: cytochrome c [Gammaproteobacteria bacterium]|nr:cytochrome c [Gammaproteobacteria bacterium]